MSTTAVVTHGIISAPAAQVWRNLMFYEQIEESPPLHLRLLLPMPIGSVGSKSAVGEQAKCLYESGHLLKRVTRIVPGQLYEFAVVEQDLALPRGVLLCGGAYALQELPGQHTQLAVTTRYLSRRGPRWLWASIEATVCHQFHRHLLSAIRKKATCP